VPNCKGEHPRRIEEESERPAGCPASRLIAIFVGPPMVPHPTWCAPAWLGCCVAASCASDPRPATRITSYRDAGVRGAVHQGSPFRKRRYSCPPKTLTARDRVAIRKFFETFVGVSLEQEDEAFADAAFKYFPRERDDLREIERRHEQLPGRPALPRTTGQAGQGPWKTAAASGRCRKSRAGTERHLEVLRNGMEQLRIVKSEWFRGCGGCVPGGPHPPTLTGPA